MNQRVELLGVRIRGTDVLRDVEIPLGPGLNALVGRNGAGKSRILDVLGRVFNGEGTPGVATHLLFRVVKGDPDSRTAVFMPTLRPPLTGVDEAADFADLLLRSVTDRLTKYLWNLLQRLQSLSEEPLMVGGVDLNALNPPPQVPELEALAAALSSAQLLAWVQNGRSPARLWAASEARPEGPEKYLLELFHDAWSQADLDYEMTRGVEWFDDVPLTYEHMGQQFEYVPDEPDPSSGDQLPVPCVPLGPEVSRATHAHVLTDGVNVEQVIKAASDHVVEMAGWRDMARGTAEYIVQEAARSGESPDEFLDDLKLVAAPPPPLVDEWSLAATDSFRQLTPAAVEMRCRVRPLRDWFQMPALDWQAKDPASGGWVPLSALSQSQGRWARLSVFLATVGAGPGQFQHLHADGAVAPPRLFGSFALFDEPEQGLHRTYEQAFSRGLARLARETHTTMLVATHSPLMATAADHVVEISRDADGDVTAKEISGVFADRLEAMGMLPADVLAWARAVLLVQGHHDQLVLEELIADELNEMRVLVIPIDGVKGGGAAVDAQFLTRFGLGRLVLMVDGLGDLADVWSSAQTALERDDMDEARRLVDGIGRGTVEGEFLRSAGHTLIDQRRLGEVQVVALEVADVLDLLPVKPFVKRAESWSELRKEFNSKNRQQMFKPWLAAAHGAKFTDEVIVRAVSQLDDIPDDVSRLIHALRKAVADRDPS